MSARYLFLLMALWMASSLEATLSSRMGESDPHKLIAVQINSSINPSDGTYHEEQCDLVSPGPHAIRLVRVYGESSLLETETVTLARGWCLHVDAGLERKYDARGHLIELRKVAPGSTKVLNWMRFCHTSSELVVEASNGQQCRYEYGEGGLLTRVVLPDDRSIHYSYDAAGRLTRHEENSGAFLFNTYEASTGRVAQQFAPVGTDATPLPVAQLAYGDGFTEVTNGEGQRSIYRYTIDSRLLAIETYLGESLYRTERFYWAADQLRSYAVMDGANSALFCRTFNYDGAGQRTETALYGNLTGQGADRFALDVNGLPVGNVEHATVLFQYNQAEKPQLLSVREENGRMIFYRYDPTTKRLVAKLLWDGSAIRQRLFYRYDAYGTCIETLIDDGHGEDPADLQGVTQRKIVRIVPRTEVPGFGLPVVVDEKYLDLTSGSEQLLRTTLNIYDAQARLVSQEFFNGQDEHVGFVHSLYDAAGRLVRSMDGTGAIESYQYEPNGIQQEVIGSDGQRRSATSTRHDLVGRLISKSIRDSQGEELHSSFRYDRLGQLVLTVDPYGNETTYHYDALGRPTQVISPTVLDAADEPYAPRTSRDYDLLDRVVSTTDAGGAVTQTSYNLRGQPLRIVYADGTSESFRYQVDGTLCESRARNGVITRYTRDLLSRVIEKQLISTDGQVLTSLATHSGFQITSFTDSRGYQTLYSYDGAGRVVSAVSYSGEGETRREWGYDAAGHIKEVKEWFGEGEGDYSCLLLDQDSVSLTDGAQHQLVRSSSKTSSQAPPSKEEKRRMLVNQLGQKVLQTVKHDARGSQQLVTHDALGRAVCIDIQDAMGKLVNRQEIRYDGVGHKVLEKTARLGHGNESDNYVVRWRYNSMNGLEELSEAVGTSQQANSRYHYNRLGQLEQVAKPNGILLTYLYDGFGRVKELHSSDRTVAYGYQYDEANNPTAIRDLITGNVTRRHYDAFNRVMAEELANGLYLHQERDLKGRVTHIALPDGSGIDYLFDAARLLAVKRVSQTGDLVYSHQFSKYGETGELQEATLLGDLGKVAFKRDKQGQLLAIQSAYWSAEITKDDPSGIVTQLQISDLGGKYRLRFEYDAQGQLTGEGGSGMCGYSYDALGNRLSKGVDAYQINAGNQLVRTAEASYTYDANGNCLSKQVGEQLTHYTYDGLDRLVAVETAEQRVVYMYDGFHRRVVQRVWQSDPTHGKKGFAGEQRYLYEGKRELGIADATGALQQLRILAPGSLGDVGAAVALELQGEVYAPIHDHRGSLVCLVSQKTRQVEEYYRLSAFGEEQLFDQQARRFAAVQAKNPWRFSSKRHDSETGLVNHGRRLYDPAIGRWISKDPLGDVEGPNGYRFVRNNPVMLVDPEGLTSADSVWNSLYDMADSYIQYYASLAWNVIDLFRRDGRFFTDMRDDALLMGHQLIGPRVLDAMGLYGEEPEIGVVGDNEIGDKVRFSFINGILNNRNACLATARLISQLHGGVNIHYTFRPSSGWAWDYVNAFFVRMGFASPTTHCLANHWKSMIEEMGGSDAGGMIIHYAHSLGGAETANARHFLDSKEQAMIRVFTFGSPILLSSDGFQSVSNYVSRLDPICLFDPVRYAQSLLSGNSNVTFVGTYWGIPVLDHLLRHPNYWQVLEALGRNYSGETETYYAAA